ncbi:MAG: DivIVA domain-containing protein [Bifidobacterium bifidum]
MAHQDGADKGASGIARVGKRKWGYDPDQVDAFLDRAHALYESEDAHLTQQDIQNVSFDLSKGGYDITQVDAALSRLEQAVVDKQTTREITEHGRVAWKAQTEELYRQVCEHADRGTGERFARGHDRRPSYDRKQVDRLIDQIVDKAAAGLGVDGVSEQDVRKLADLNSGAVSNVVFTQRKGKNGYDERQVDYYLNSCVQLLSRLESFARLRLCRWRSRIRRQPAFVRCKDRLRRGCDAVVRRGQRLCTCAVAGAAGSGASVLRARERIVPCPP